MSKLCDCIRLLSLKKQGWKFYQSLAGSWHFLDLLSHSLLCFNRWCIFHASDAACQNLFVENKEPYWFFILDESKNTFKNLFEICMPCHTLPGILFSVNVWTLFPENKEVEHKCQTATVYNLEKTIIFKKLLCRVQGSLRYSECLVWNSKRAKPKQEFEWAKNLW